MKVRSRKTRQLKDALKKAGIWAFIAIFAISILGVAVVSVAR